MRETISKRSRSLGAPQILVDIISGKVRCLDTRPHNNSILYSVGMRFGTVQYTTPIYGTIQGVPGGLAWYGIP